MHPTEPAPVRTREGTSFGVLPEPPTILDTANLTDLRN